jgi:hypothetical protein
MNELISTFISAIRRKENKKKNCFTFCKVIFWVIKKIAACSIHIKTVF